MLVVLAAAVALVVGGAGTAYAARYQDRALPGTTVAGASVSGMTRAELAQEVRERAAQVTVTLRAGQTTRTARLAELGYTVDVDATVDAVLEANDSWSSYATSLVSSRHLRPVLRTDAAAGDRLVAELVATPARRARMPVSPSPMTRSPSSSRRPQSARRSTWPASGMPRRRRRAPSPPRRPP